MNTASACGDGPYLTKGKVKSFLPKPSSYGFRSNKTAEDINTKLTKPVPDQPQKSLLNGSESRVLNEGSKATASQHPSSSFWSLKVGCRVCVSGAKCGILKYYGETRFAAGYWCGIRLDEPVGKNNGSVDGVTYFLCPDNCGIFAPPSKVEILEDVDERKETFLDTTYDSLESKASDHVGATIQHAVPYCTEPFLELNNGDACSIKVPSKGKSGESFKKPLTSRLLQPKIFTSKIGTLERERTGSLNEPITKESNEAFKTNGDLNVTVDIPEPAVFNGCNQNKGLYSRLKFTRESALSSCEHANEKSALNETRVVGHGSNAVPSSNQFERGDYLDTHDENFHVPTNYMQGDLNITYSHEQNDVFLDAELTYVANIPECRNIGSNVPVTEDGVSSAAFVNDTFIKSLSKTEHADVVNSSYTVSKEVSSKPFDEADLTELLAENGPDYEYDDYEGFGRQGSFDLDDSLGILTPNQIREFTVCNENLFKTPSVEDVQELKDEVIDDIIIDRAAQFDKEHEGIKTIDKVVATSTPLHSSKSMISEVPSVMLDNNVSYLHLSQFQTPKAACGFKNAIDLSRINDIEETNEFSMEWSGLNTTFPTIVDVAGCEDLNSNSKPTVPPGSNEQRMLRKALHNFDVTEQSIVFAKSLDVIPPSVSSKSDDHTFDELGERMATNLADKLVKNVLTDSLREVIVATSMTQVKIKGKLQIKEDEEVTEYLMQKMGPNFQDHMAEKRDRPISSLTVSVTSIDTGYQGDAECDAPSAATSAINTPIDEQKKLFGEGGLNETVCVLRHAKNDGSDSDFCSDMGTSWTESEMENEEKIRGRSARVIDGKLYYNDGEMDQQHAIDFENQIEAILSKNLQNKTNSEKAETLQQVDDGGESYDSNATIIAGNNLPVSSSPVPDIGNKTDHEGNVLTDLEVSPLTVASTPSQHDSVDTKESIKSIAEASIESVTELNDKKKADTEPTSKSVNKNEQPKPKLSTSSQSSSRSTIKREATRLSDDSKKAAKKVKIPKKNVVSKIKAMIESSGTSKSPTKEEDKPEVPKKARTPKKSRWDAVMSKIAAGQAEEKSKSKVKKEIKSRIDTNLSGSKQVPKLSDGSFRSPKERNTSGRSQTQRSFQRDLTLSSEPTYDHVECERSLQGSNHSSHSDLSISLPEKSHQRSKISQHANNSKSDRPGSPSQLSNVSTVSITSRVSVVSHASQVSHQLQASNCSINSMASNVTGPCVLKTKESSKRPTSIKHHTTPSETKSFEKRNSAAGILKSHAAAVAAASSVGGSTSPQRALNKVHAKSNGAGAQRVSKTSVLSRASATKPLPARTQPAKEQARLRNAKNQQLPFINKSSPLQPDILNSSSVSTTPRRTPAKEIARLEALCEKHVKEKHHMKSYIEQQNRGFEALTMVIHYMNNELSAFSHPQMTKTISRLEDQLAANISALEKETAEKNELHSQMSAGAAAHTSEINTMKEEHMLHVADLQQMLEQQRAEEIQKLRTDFENECETRSSCHLKEVENLKKQYEHASEETKAANQKKIEELEANHSLQLEELQQKFKHEMTAAQENHAKIKKELEEKVENFVTKCEALQQEKRDFEEQIMKDSDYKVQVVALKVTNLEKEVDSLKLVIEMKKKEIHQLRKENIRLKGKEEELRLAEEKIKLLSTKAEDLQAQVVIKNNKERQISSEVEVLKDCYVKESQISKRLSMEKEELQWRLQQSMEGSQLFSILSDPSEHQELDLTSSSLSPLRCHSASGSPMTVSRVRYLERSSYPLQTREPSGRLQRYSISESDFQEGYDAIGAQYRRSGSFSWTSSPRETSKETCTSVESASYDETVIRKEIEQLSGCLEMQSDEETTSSMMSDSCKDESETNDSQVDGGDGKTEEKSACGADVENVPEFLKEKEKRIIKNKRVQPQEDFRVPSLITVNNFSSPELSLRDVTPIKNRQSLTSRKRSKSSTVVKKSSHKEQKNKELAEAVDGFDRKLDATFEVESSFCNDSLFPPHEQEENGGVDDQVNLEGSSKYDGDEGCIGLTEDQAVPTEKCDHESQDLEDSYEQIADETTLPQEIEDSIIDLDYTAMHLKDGNESQASSMENSVENNGSVDSSAFEALAGLKNPEDANFDWLSSRTMYVEDNYIAPDDKETIECNVLNSTRTIEESRSPTSNSPTSLPSEHSELVNSSQSSTSQSETSSPQISPVFRTRSGLESSDGPSRNFAMSPRTSAGEAMIAELPNPHLHSNRQLQDSASFLLRRTFHDQFITENASSSNSPTRAPHDSGGRDSSSEEASQLCISKPATPESSSQAVGPTDSTNIDLSWSDEEEDGIPFESEV